MSSTPAAAQDTAIGGGTGDDTGTVDTAGVIAGARGRIDDLDARIIALVRERMTVSAGIQRARIESGGRRVHLSREMEILHRYSDQLGKPGTALAMTLLELCRGRA
jgi:chorismate mutase